jgi:glycosyltransferase involved in cell wall biosynthesis
VDAQYTYSIIIPHKNIPRLLERCLASIPEREDVQVIVVDDGSDPGIVDFAHFPGLRRSHTEVIFHKSAIGGQGGSGVARNVGIEAARGRWLVFADADDFFHPSISDAFDRHADADADIIFFRHDGVDSATGEAVEINTSRNRHLAEFDRTGDEKNVRYMIWVPWGRFIRRELVREHSIRFDPVRFSNDRVFSVKAGYFAEKIVSDPATVYCNARRTGSLIHEGRTDWTAMSQRFEVDYHTALFLRSAGEGPIFDRVVAERWKELSLLHRWKARRLLPRLREVCSPGEVRRVRFEETLRRAFSLLDANRRKRNLLKSLQG